MVTMIRQNTYPSEHGDEHSAVAHEPRRHSAIEPDWTPSKPSAPGADHLSESAEPASKRRRVALACTCDGARPKCSLCIELGFECVYQQSSSYSNIIVGKEYLSSIEDRLKLVEGRLASLETRNHSTVRPSINPTAGPAADNASSTIVNDSAGETAQPEAACVRDDSLDDAETNEDPIDGMGAVTFAEEEDCAFFGPSSNIAFLRNVSRAVARLTNDSQPWRPSPAERNSVGYTGGFINASRPASPAPTHHEYSHEKVNIYALPTDSAARQLLAWYFSNTGVLFPYLHEQTFMAIFDQASKDKFRGVRRTWLALLNMTFAHAAVHARDISTTPASVDSTAFRADAESEIYFQRAYGLYNGKSENGAGTSVEVVILLLLMGQYLQGTQKSVQTWKMHGLAVRAAFQIGLHSSDLAGVFPPIEQEIRKRTWFGCIMLDRTLSMTFGRPASIPESYVQLELPIELPTLSGGLVGSDRKESLSIAFYNGTATLYKVLCTTIDNLYGQNLACSFHANAVDTVALVYKIENELMEWQRGLPTHMRLIATQDIMPESLPSAETSTENAWRQLRLRFILTLRYTNVRILLHRPVLVKFLEGMNNPADNQDFSLLQQVGAIHMQITIKSAKEIILLVLKALQSASGRAKWGLLGAWWFTLYYTFNAALVLGACVLVQVDQKSTAASTGMSLADSTEDMTLHLSMAIEALRYLDNDNRMVARCRDYLEQFVQVVHALAMGQHLVPQPQDWQAQQQQQQASYRQAQQSQMQAQYPHQQIPQVQTAGDYALLQNTAAGMFNNGVGMISSTKQSPLGMELGEFMMEGDLDFLSSHSFAYNRGVAQ